MLTPQPIVNENAQPVCRCTDDNAPYQQTVNFPTSSGTQGALRIHYHEYCGTHCNNYQEENHPIWGHHLPYVWYARSQEAVRLDTMGEVFADGTFHHDGLDEDDDDEVDENGEPDNNIAENPAFLTDLEHARIEAEWAISARTDTQDWYNGEVTPTTPVAELRAWLWRINYDNARVVRALAALNNLGG
jgi:hypothetical protein